MNNFTIFNFFTSATARLAKSKSYVVTLLFLLAFAPNATAQNGNYTLNNSHEGAYVTTINDGPDKLTPFNTLRNSKQQYLYYANEFATAPNNLSSGGGEKVIKSMAFNVVKLTNNHNIAGFRHTFKNMKIRIANVSINSFGTNATAPYSSTSDPFGNQWDTIPASAQFVMDVPDFQVSNLGWFTFDLIDTNTGDGFKWDGTSNILVEFSSTTNAGTLNSSPDQSQGYFYGVEGTRMSHPDGVTRVVGAFTHSRAVVATGTKGVDMVQGGPGHNINNWNNPSNSKLAALTERNFRPTVRFKMDCGYWNLGGTAQISTTVIPNTQGCRQMKLTVTGGSRGYGITYHWETSDTYGFLTQEILPSSNTEDYVATQSNVGKYYRRVTNCGGNIKKSDPVYLPPAAINVYDIVTHGGWSNGEPDEFSGNYLYIKDGIPTLNADAKACGCEVGPSQNLIIESDITLRVDGALKVNGNLTVNDGASLLQSNPIAVNTGNITVRLTTQEMVVYDYTYYGSPVQNATLESFSPNTLFDKYFKWNPGIQNWEGVVKTSVMAPGQGYIIRAPQGWTSEPAVFAGQFVGKPNNGTITTAIKTGATKMNMVVNPYPSPLDLDMFQAANSSKLDGTYYFWTHNTPINGTTLQYAQNDFAMYNGTGGTAATPGDTVPNGKVAIGQGFMVKGKGSVIADDTVIYSNDMRLPANVDANFYRQSTAISDVNASKSRYWLNFTGSTAFKQILVGYVNGASADYDNGFDGEISADASASFYSTLGDYQLGIQGRGLPFSSSDVVPLGFKVASPGTYKIALNDFEGLFTQQNIYLVDKVANVTHNLKNGAYEFITTAGVHNERFEITYVSLSPQLSVATNGVSETANDFIAFKQANDLVIDAKGSQIDMIRVFDLSGRMLIQQNGVDASDVIIANPNWASQVLIVQMHTTDKLVFTKKVVF